MLKLNDASIRDAIYTLVGELDKLAQRACDRHDTNGVHYLVSESRRIANIQRALEMRGLIER